MENFDFKTVRNDAMRLGLSVGITWIISFYMFVYSFPSIFMLIAILIGMLSIVQAGRAVRLYRRMKQWMTGLRCWWMLWFAFMCATLLTTCAQLIYFKYLDHGSLVNKMQTMISDEGLIKAYESAGMTESLEQLRISISSISQMSVSQVAWGFLESNIMIGFIFSAISMLFILGTNAGDRAKQTE